MNIIVTYYEDDYMQQKMYIQQEELTIFLTKPKAFLPGSYDGRLIAIKVEQIVSIQEEK